MKIVGLTGRRRSGKDTAALSLISHGYERVSFAGPLKAMLDALLVSQGVPNEEVHRMIEGDLKEVETPYLNGRSPRHAMQTLGTEWGRELIDSNLWVRAALRSAEGKGAVVFTDVRFPNEVEAIKAAGGVVIKVVRPSNEAEDVHSSEALIDTLEVNSSVINCGTVDDLHKRLRTALTEIIP